MDEKQIINADIVSQGDALLAKVRLPDEKTRTTNTKKKGKKKSRRTTEYGGLAKRDSDTRCNARMRSKHGWEYCKSKAGLGTSHEGNGRCRKHGGIVAMSHGRYSQYVDTSLAQMLADERDVVETTGLSLVDELSLARAILKRQLQGESDEDGETEFNIVQINMALSTIQRLTEAELRVQSSRNVPYRRFVEIMQFIIKTIQKHVTDKSVAQAITDELLTIVVS